MSHTTHGAVVVFALSIASLLLAGGCGNSASEGYTATTVGVEAATPPPSSGEAEEDGDSPQSEEGSFDAGTRADPSASEDSFVLALLPLGELGEEEIRTVVDSVRSVYGAGTQVLPAHDLPASAYYEPRKRYRAERLLTWLGSRIPPGADRIMGLTAKDISTVKGEHRDWGVCGLAYMPGDAAVISTFRIRKKLGRGLTQEERRERFLARLADLAAHELGHGLGLDHCPNRGCIMEDAKGTVATFNHSTGRLCNDCVDELRRLGFAVR